MTHATIWNSHPKTYGKGSRRCRLCPKRQGLIRKYHLDMCRNCFQEKAEDLGFKKPLDIHTIKSTGACQRCPAAAEYSDPSKTNRHNRTRELRDQSEDHEKRIASKGEGNEWLGDLFP
ncbi:30S ribosomal protein S14p/S29e [Planoprotostelium fungivorum]|uniref:30S ribosomal protein S14p/S29e n=1 Tax=Planoprotostelium fungivorum TaxID=1890364 RepID=A0A2P6ND05_9EUKA|nr:30S ribosomal protein S14p/S29e [Planoprotostelium fungivorum]